MKGLAVAMADANSRDKSTKGRSQDGANSRTAVVVTSQQQMEWEASNYKWDAYSMRGQEAAATGTPATAAVTSGRRSARISAGLHMKQVLGNRNSRSKRSNEPLVCQVPSCHESLATCKEYYQRYRICTMHAKADAVEIDSIAQRFCQQCGRFHGLDQFEGTKHSCRQQLLRHNTLRRRGPAAAAAAPNHSSVSVTAIAAATVGPATFTGSVGSSLRQRSATAVLPASHAGLVPVLFPVWPNMDVAAAASLGDLPALATAQQNAAALAAAHQQQRQQEQGQHQQGQMQQQKPTALQRVTPLKASSTESNTQHMASCSTLQPASSGGLTGDFTTQQQAGTADAAAAAETTAGSIAASVAAAAAASGLKAPAAVRNGAVGWGFQPDKFSTVQPELRVQAGFEIGEHLSSLSGLEPEVQQEQQQQQELEQQQQQQQVLLADELLVTSAQPSDGTALAPSPQGAAAVEPAAADLAADAVMQDNSTEQQQQQRQQQQVWQQHQQEQRQVWQRQQPQQVQLPQGLWQKLPQQPQPPAQQAQPHALPPPLLMNAGTVADWAVAAAGSTAAVAPVAAAAALNPEGSSEVLLKELLDDLWATQTGSADVAAQALEAQGVVAQAAAAAPTAAPAAVLVPPFTAAKDGSDPLATQALESIMQQLATQQQFGLPMDPQQQQQQLSQHMQAQQQQQLHDQQQERLSQHKQAQQQPQLLPQLQQQQQQQAHISQHMQMPQLQLQLHEQQQQQQAQISQHMQTPQLLQLQDHQLQQQQVPAGLSADPYLRQSSNSSCMSGPCNSSGSGNAAQACVGMRQSHSSGGDAAAADAALYSYSGYTAVCQVQPGYQLQTVPVPDELFASLATELGPLAPEQQQQQSAFGAAASAAAAAASGVATTTPLLVQQAPLVQAVGMWQGGSSSGVSPGVGLGYDTAAATDTAAAAAAAVFAHGQGNPALLQGQQLRIADVSACIGVSTYAVQQQQQQHQMSFNSLQQPLTGPAAAGVGGSTAAWSNLLAGPLSAAQRAAAAGHVRSMLLVAAAAGEASHAVMSRALQLMEQCGDWVPYTAMMQLNCLSMKLLGAHPCALAADLREQLITAVVGATMPEAFLRPGCCLLSLDYVIAATHEDSGELGSSSRNVQRSAADVLLSLCSNSSWFAEQRMRIQLGSSIATWDLKQQQQQQQQQQVGSAAPGSSSSSNSTVATAVPSVCLASSPAVLQEDWQQTWVALSCCHGSSYTTEQLEISIRGGGQYYQLDTDSIVVEPYIPKSGSSSSSSNWSAWLGARLRRGPGKAVRSVPDRPDEPDRPCGKAVAGASDAAGGSVLVWFRLAEPPRPGALRVEVTCCSTGACGTAVLLVSDDPQLVAEINATYDAPIASTTAAAAAAYLRSSSSSRRPALTASERDRQLQSLLFEAGFVLELKLAFQYAHAHNAGTAAANTSAAAVAGSPFPSSSSSSSSASSGSSTEPLGSNGSSSTPAFAGRRLHHYTSKEIALVVRTARRLVAAAVAAGCPATAAALLPVAGVGVSCPEQLLAAVGAEGLRRLGEEWRGVGLLHMAVASQSVQAVSWLLSWGQAAGVNWLPYVTASAGLPGLTPLHLAVLAGDAAALAELLTDISPAAAAAWFGKVLSTTVTNTTTAPAAAAAASAGSSSSMSAGCSSAAAGQELRANEDRAEQQQTYAAATCTASSSSTAHPQPEIVLLREDSVRCCGLTPAALAALVGRVVLNAAIARKLPVAGSCELIHEAATEAADVAAAGSQVANLDVQEDPVKPKPLSGMSNRGWQTAGESTAPLCPTCQLPLASFNRAWHHHHDPAHVLPLQQQQQVEIPLQPQQPPIWDSQASLPGMSGVRIPTLKGFGCNAARATGDRSGACMQGLQILQQQQLGGKHDGGCVEPQGMDGSEGGLMTLQVLLALLAGLLLLGLGGAAFVHCLEKP